MTIRVCAIEDDARYRDSLAALFTHAPGFTWGGAYARPADALEAAAVSIARGETQPWDVVLMDLDLPGMHGVEVTRRLKAMLPNIQIVVLTVFEDVNSIVNAICAGADGYLLKQGPPEELRNGIVRVHAGERVLHQAALQALVARAIRPMMPPVEALSAREREILGYLADGATSKEIAVTLGLAPKTVENHRARILDKLGVANSAAAVRCAVARGLLPS